MASAPSKSRPSISGNERPAMPCMSPHMPAVAWTITWICCSRLAQDFCIALRSFSRSACMSWNFSTMASTRCRKRGPDRHRHCNGAFRRGDPDAVDLAENIDGLGQRLGNQDRRIGLGGALVVAQFLQPAVAPIARALRFPKDFSALLAERRGHLLDRVAAELALGNRRDRVMREAPA